MKAACEIHLVNFKEVHALAELPGSSGESVSLNRRRDRRRVVVRSEISEVIAVRELSLLLDDGRVRAVSVKIGKPHRVQETEAYRCHFQFVGFDNDKVRYAEGDDGMQAIILALTKIASLLYTSAEFKSMRLTSHGHRNLGFPLFVDDPRSTLVPGPVALLLM